MPNWCDNTLTVSGRPEELNKFKLAIQGYGITWGDEHEIIDVNDTASELVEKMTSDRELLLIDFSKLVMPSKEFLSKSFIDVGYHWQIDNWGTKGQPNEISLTEKPRSIIYIFCSAWSPPIPIVKEMILQYPTLKFSLKYYECGAGFRGILRGEKGEVTDESCSDYKGNKGG
jgi:hypothetical protein